MVGQWGLTGWGTAVAVLLGLVAVTAIAGGVTAEATEEPQASAIVDAARDPGPAGPGERVASVLSAVAEEEGLAAPTPSASCPSLATALAWHADRHQLASASLEEPVPARLDAALGCLLGAVHSANLAMDATFQGVPTSELVPYVTGEQRTPPPGMLAGRSHAANLQASIEMAWAVDRALEHLDALEAQREELPRIDVEPIVRFEPRGDTSYTDNYAVIVDLAGEDLYDNHAGGVFAAVGNGIYEVEDGSAWYETQALGRPVSVGGNTQDASAALTSSLVLDTAADDTYGERKPAILDDAEHGCAHEPVVPMVGTIGAGILGVGQLYDLEGDDAFIGRTQTMGAGHILGVGALYAGPGNDTFDAVRSTQGQGLLGGVGVLVTEPGASTYHAEAPEGGVFNADLRFCDDEARYAQGSAFDRRNGPLLPSVGVLADRGGPDTYRSELLSQGFGQGPGAGALVDRGGDDTYTAVDQSQAYAQGRSRAFNPNAPGGAGEAVLWDEAGEDRYAMEEERGQGYALAEVPQGPPAIDPTNLLEPAFDRDEAAAKFVDREGTDDYLGPEGRSNGEFTVEGVVGVFWDVE